MQHYGGGAYKGGRFTEEGFSKEATSTSYASYLESLLQGNCAPPPAVGTCPQPRKGFAEESALARDSRQHDTPYGDSFHELDRLREPKKNDDTSPSYASYLGTLLQDNCAPPPAVGTWPQPRRKGVHEESALARDSRQHDNAYGDSFHELDGLREPKKYHEIDSFQVVEKFRDSYHGNANYYGHGYDMPARLDGYNRADFPHDNFDDMPRISRIMEVSQQRSCYDSDYDRGGKRDDSWKRRDSREHDKRTLNRERDQSPQRRCRRSCSCGNDDRQRSRSPRGCSRRRSYPENSYDEGRHWSSGREMNHDERRSQDHSWKANDDRQRSMSPQGCSHCRSYPEDSFDEGRHWCSGRRMNQDERRSQDHSCKANDDRQRSRSPRGCSRCRSYPEDSYDAGRHLSRERDQNPKRRCQRSCSRGNDDRQRSRSPRGGNRCRSYPKDSYDEGRLGSSGKQINPVDRRSQDHSSVVPSVTVVVKGLSENTTVEDLHQILAVWGPFCRVRVVKHQNSVSPGGLGYIEFPSMVTARKMVDGIGDVGLVVDGRTLLFQFRKIKKKSQSKHEKENRRKKRIKKTAERAVQHQQDGGIGENIQQKQQKLQQQQQKQKQQLLEVDKIQHEPSSHGISSSLLEKKITCIKEDQYSKVKMEDNEICGPAVVMRFSNDPEVIQKLGDGMGFGVSGKGPDDDAEDKSAKVDTPIFHQTGGVGDIEEMDRLAKKEGIIENRKMKKEPSRSSIRKKLKRAYERAARDAQLRENTAPHYDTGYGRKECVAVTSKNSAAVPIVEEFEIGNLQHGPSSECISTSISQEDLEELMTCIKKDPYLKLIVEDIEIGGPTLMMRYLNDPEVLQKLGQAMGFGVSGEIVDATEHNAPADYAEDKTAKENDSIICDGNKGIRGHKDVVNGGTVIPARNESIAAESINFYRGFCYNCCERGQTASECPKENVQVGDEREKSNTGVGKSNVQTRGQV